MSKHHPNKEPEDLNHLREEQEAARASKAELLKHMQENLHAAPAGSAERGQPGNAGAKSTRRESASANPFNLQAFSAEWPMAGMQQLFGLQLQLFETMMQNWNSLMAQTLNNFSAAAQNSPTRRKD